MNDDRKDLFGHLGVPSPPSELRRQTLLRGKVALEDSLSDRWRGLWLNAPLRLAWVLAVIALIATHLMIKPAPLPVRQTLAQRSGSELLVSLGERGHCVTPRGETLAWGSTPINPRIGEDHHDLD